MHSMLGIQPNNFIITLFVYNMYSEYFCNLIMINLHSVV